jgi:serine/threonine protein kinase
VIDQKADSPPERAPPSPFAGWAGAAETIPDAIAPPEPVDWSVPPVESVLGKYRLIDVLGRGTASVVYLGRHLKLRVPVAVKVLRADALEGDPRSRQRLAAEAVLLARLNHPHIVRLWDLEEEGPCPYLVTEYIDGPHLDKMIRLWGALPEGLACAIARQVAEGLGAAYDLGIVHRDVKPANVLLTAERVAKVADLGLAVVGGGRGAGLGAGGDWPAGTAAYMAPEQAVDPATADHRSDMYSLGATLYHAITGRPPFVGRSPMEVIRRHLTDRPAPPVEVVPTIRPPVNDLILRLLAKDPADRFGSYADLRTALARAVGDRRAPRSQAESFLHFRADPGADASPAGADPV